MFIFKMKDLGRTLFRSCTLTWAELSRLYQSSGEMVQGCWLYLTHINSSDRELMSVPRLWVSEWELFFSCGGLSKELEWITLHRVSVWRCILPLNMKRRDHVDGCIFPLTVDESALAPQWTTGARELSGVCYPRDWKVRVGNEVFYPVRGAEESESWRVLSRPWEKGAECGYSALA